MAAAGPVAGAAGTKGLRAGALGFVSNVVIGVASTAPAYSLAVSLAGGVMLAWAFVRSAIDMADPANSHTGEAWFGVSVPLAITIITFALGVILMALWWLRSPAFFRLRPTTFEDPATTLPGVPPVGPAQHAAHMG